MQDLPGPDLLSSDVMALPLSPVTPMLSLSLLIMPHVGYTIHVESLPVYACIFCRVYVTNQAAVKEQDDQKSTDISQRLALLLSSALSELRSAISPACYSHRVSPQHI